MTDCNAALAPEERTCNRCGATKPIAGKDGFRQIKRERGKLYYSHCRPCERVTAKAHNAAKKAGTWTRVRAAKAEKKEAECTT